MSTDIRNNWQLQEIKTIYQTPLLELVFRAATLHRKYNDTGKPMCIFAMGLFKDGITE